MALATPQDVQTSLMRELTPSESQHVGALLDRAESLLRVRIPDLLNRASTDQAFKDLVIAVEAEAVARVFRNPEGYRQETEGNYGYSVNMAVASGLLSILDEEWLRLGISPLVSIAPAMDGYAAKRYGARPDLAFQFHWPAQDDMDEQVWP